MATMNPLDRAGSTTPARDSNDFLYSWKEMASFLKCGVRTVQRWEKSEGLPVHRHRHWKRGTVYALKSEVQAWLASRSEKTDSSAFTNHSLTPNGIHAALDNSLLYTLCEQARERAHRARAHFDKPREKALKVI